MTNSNFSLSNWFGVLFINVFGTWEGSFGMNTAAGTVGGRGGMSSGTDMKVFQFVPADSSATVSKPKYRLANVTSRYTAVEGASTSASQATGDNELPATAVAPAKAAALPAHASQRLDWVIVAFGGFIGISLLGAERYLTFRARNKA